MTEIYRRLGQRLRQERERLGWTQEELGEKAGLHPSYIGQIERCRKKVSLATVEGLAAALGIGIGVLLDERLPASKLTNWQVRIDGILRDRSRTEQDFLYNTLKQLARDLRKIR
jgi:transcriptional regulator with XRE-family HTH domain